MFLIIFCSLGYLLFLDLLISAQLVQLMSHVSHGGELHALRSWGVFCVYVCVPCLVGQRQLSREPLGLWGGVGFCGPVQLLSGTHKLCCLKLRILGLLDFLVSLGDSRVHGFGYRYFHVFHILFGSYLILLNLARILRNPTESHSDPAKSC